MRGRGYRARSVADGRQQLDRRESDAIIAGQLAFAVIIGVGWMEVGGDQGAGGTGRTAYRGMHSRAASIIRTNVYMNDRAAAAPLTIRQRRHNV